MPEPMIARHRLSSTEVGLVESLAVHSTRRPMARAESYSPDYQICVPYRGLFVWHVGRDDVAADPTRVLFVRGGEGFRVSQPADGGYAELIVTMPPALLAEHLGLCDSAVGAHPLFHARTRPTSWPLQQLALRRVHAASQHWDDLTSDEWLLAFVRAALGAPPSCGRPAPSPRVLLRAKAYLAEHFAHGIRLAEVARAVDVSPAYLTTLFTHSEGVSLHQYILRLRLARALLELPHTDDLSQLALDLGFAHHSHFTHAFRRATGCTPSHYRELGRSERRRLVRDVTCARRGEPQPGRPTAIESF